MYEKKKSGRDVKIPNYVREIKNDSRLSNNILLRKLVNLIKAGTNDLVLDIGCGAFNATKALYQSVKKIVALDEFPNPKEDFVPILKQLKKEGKVEVIESDISRINIIFKPNTFDIVVAYFSLHHFPDISNLVQNVNNILKKGGKFYISEGTFLNDNLRYIFDLLRIFRYNNYRKYCKPDEIIQLLLREGFSIHDYSVDAPFFDSSFEVEDLISYCEKGVLDVSAKNSIIESISAYLTNLPVPWRGENVDVKIGNIFYDCFEILGVKK